MNETLGSEFKGYELNQAINYYLLSPYQYSLNEPKFTVPGLIVPSIKAGMQYDDTIKPVEKLTNIKHFLPIETSTKKFRTKLKRQKSWVKLSTYTIQQKQEHGTQLVLWHWSIQI